MFPLSSGLTRGPILNQVLNPLTKARVNSPFKVHSSKNEYDVQRLLYAKFILTFTHGHNVHNGVLYVQSLTETTISNAQEGDPQETFGGGQAPKFWFERLPWAWICIPMTTCCYDSSTS